MTRIEVKKKVVDEKESVDVIEIDHSHIYVILSLYCQDKLESYGFLTPEEAFKLASELMINAKLAKGNRPTSP
jgi:hypothetical protein